MPIPVLLYFIFMGVAFIAWVYIWFRALLELKVIATKRRAEQKAGYFKSIGINNTLFREFATRPEHRKRFRQVVALTLLMFAVILVGRFALPVPS